MNHGIYVPSYQNLGRHPKTKRAARALSISLPQLVGHLQFLWWWALDYAPDGDITQYDNSELADAALWEGNPNVFVEALADCGVADCPGFIERTEDGHLILHDWYDGGGKVLESREKHAEVMRQARDRKRDSHESARDGHVTVTGTSRDEHVTSKDKTREDKRRQESIRAAALEKEGFESFWSEVKKYYPARDGKRTGIDSTAREYASKLPESDWPLVLKATTNYALSTDYPVDPPRFFKSREYPKGLWREFVNVTPKMQPTLGAADHPPMGYSWDQDEYGNWRTMNPDASGRWPYGAKDLDEVQEENERRWEVWREKQRALKKGGAVSVH